MIRAASPDDLEDLARVERGAAHAPWSEEALRGSLASPTCRAFLAGEPAAGWALGSAVAGEGELLAIAVLPEARRQGHARELLAALERWWREQGVERAWLEVRVDNAPALALYEAAGWRRTGLRRGYYRDGADAAVLAWSPGALGGAP